MSGTTEAAVAKQICADGGRAAFVRTAVGDPDSVQAMAAFAADEFGGIDFLVNNAAIYGQMQFDLLLSVDWDYYKKFVGVNLDGALACTRACYQHMVRRGCWADLIMHMGPVGAGTRAKLARNLLHFAAFTAAAEAQRLARAAGIDLRKLAKVVRHSDAVTGGPGMIMLRPTTAPLDAADPLREILENVRALAEKDLSLALQLGADLGVDLPMARLALASFAAGLGLPETREPAR